ETPHFRNWHVGRDSEDAEVDRRVDARGESHADRVAGQNRRKGKDRWRPAHPVAERRRLNPRREVQELLHVYARLQPSRYLPPQPGGVSGSVRDQFRLLPTPRI